MGIPNKNEAIAGLATRADFLSEKCRLLQSEVRELKSRVEGLKVNRDSLFEENKRFRADLQTSNDKIMELERKVVEAKACVEDLQISNQARLVQVVELKSELEGRMDGAHEVITQLKTRVTTLEQLLRDIKEEPLCAMKISQVLNERS